MWLKFPADFDFIWNFKRYLSWSIYQNFVILSFIMIWFHLVARLFASFAFIWVMRLNWLQLTVRNYLVDLSVAN